MHRVMTFKFLVAIAWLLSFSSVSAATQVEMSEYVLGSGDSIRIQVYGEPDLTVETQLTDTGILSYPFIGEIRLLGMTVGELQKKITEGLSGDYLVDPKVTVSIQQYRNFYVNGEVTRPGGFTFQPGLTVRKAISLAGGFTERASKGEIYLISEKEEGAEPRKVGLNTRIKPGDIITIEQSFF
ncbi:MAG: capsular biosynthesis protein [Pseudomonadales bacterium]|jgi:polysaccharide biosynthesis/export protein VpsN|nr:capsular biosynthesis protein [Pseudomonadales bacterium]RLT89526.1 MAG: polysaccharide export protein [Ketobacter sp. GenoA1]RLT94920.1 MAG: polysaccharide export protein [Ketobacter sp.]TNC85883.1 MAG: capsular biosynthesis protein [Alcanivorax sp.]HAG97269.1 capsular biosynthesis protein [Gammaproteobacteria bacterium]